MKKKETFKNINFPIVRNVQAKTIAQDIKGFDPNNPKDVAEWGEQMRKMWSHIKEMFDAKGIPMPTISIDHTPGPITYGIKTVDKNGKTLHTLIPPKDESN